MDRTNPIAQNKLLSPKAALNHYTATSLSLLVLFSPTAFAYQCDNLPVWNAETAYNGGAEVKFQSNAYQANWWSQNAKPSEKSGSFQEWTLLGACDASGGNQLPTLSILSPVEGANIASGNTITFQADASDVDDAIVSVAFVVNGQVVSTVTSAPYRADWLATVGSYTLEVIATDERGAKTTQSRLFSVSVTENQPPSITLSADSLSVSVDQPVTLSAAADDVDGSVTSVRYVVDGVTLSTLTTPPWTTTWTPAAVGQFAIQAIATDDGGLSTQSQLIDINVSSAASGGQCTTLPSYVAGSQYSSNEKVKNIDEVFQCKVAGWCSSSSAWAYEPGVGQYWQDAWDSLGSCGASPVVSILSPSAGQTVLLGSDVTIEADATDSDGTVVSVEASVDGTSLGALTQAPYTWLWNVNTLTSATISIVATDDQQRETQASTTVNVTDQVLTSEIIQPTSGSIVPLDKPVYVAVSAQSLQSDIAKAELYVNGQLVATDSAAPYEFSWQPAAIGGYQLTASVSDTQGNQVVSNSVSVEAKSIVLPKHKLIGYWHNFVNGSGCPMPLSEMSKDWDIIDIAFADNDRNSNGTVHFNLYNGDIHSSCLPIDPLQFKQDIASLQSEGKVFVLSLGGAEGTITLNTAADEAAFVSSLTAIIQEWGFDGLDIDLESGSNLVHGSQIQARLPTALRQIQQNMGRDMYLTMAPEHPYVQGGMVAYSGIWGAYIPVIDQVRDMLNLLHVQLYNNGGLANPYTTGAAAEGSVDMMVAASKMLTEGFELADGSMFQPLRDDQVAIGLPSGPSSANSGQAPIANIEAALDCMVLLQRCGSVQPTQLSPNFGGVMTWSINWDQHDGFNFSAPVKAKLNQLNNR
ncbi:Ig-like domain-containing protein [Vibrio cionasavignyae]|uniref:Ig-like domain-containing protein n=1 Tax=Vibrio cionasavignyae TaxID=2910252 RepID=UPI003D152600